MKDQESTSVDKADTFSAQKPGQMTKQNFISPIKMLTEEEANADKVLA